MTEYEFTARGLALIFGVAAGVGMWVWVWVPYSREVLRQDLFSLRRRLFVYMADGKISPDEHAYGLLRHTINGMLYIADEITFLDLAIRIPMSRGTRAQWRKMQAETLKPLSKEQRRELKQIHDQITGAMLRHLWRSSPAFLALTGILVVVILVRGLARGLATRIRPLSDMSRLVPVPMVESQAYELSRTRQSAA